MELFDINLLIFMDAYFLLFLTALFVYFTIKGYAVLVTEIEHRYLVSSVERPKCSPCLLYFFYSAIKHLITFIRGKTNNSNDEEHTHIIPHIQV